MSLLFQFATDIMGNNQCKHHENLMHTAKALQSDRNKSRRNKQAKRTKSYKPEPKCNRKSKIMILCVE